MASSIQFWMVHNPAVEEVVEEANIVAVNSLMLTVNMTVT